MTHAVPLAAAVLTANYWTAAELEAGDSLTSEAGGKIQESQKTPGKRVSVRH